MEAADGLWRMDDGGGGWRLEVGGSCNARDIEAATVRERGGRQYFQKRSLRSGCCGRKSIGPPRWNCRIGFIDCPAIPGGSLLRGSRVAEPPLRAHPFEPYCSIFQLDGRQFMERTDRRLARQEDAWAFGIACRIIENASPVKGLLPKWNIAPKIPEGFHLMGAADATSALAT